MSKPYVMPDIKTHTSINRLMQEPILKFNRNLHDRLTAEGFKGVTIDFDIVDPIGDFVENPDLPVCTLVRSASDNVTPMCLFNIPRGVDLGTWFIDEEQFVFMELITALQGSREKQKLELADNGLVDSTCDTL